MQPSRRKLAMEGFRIIEPTKKICNEKLFSFESFKLTKKYCNEKPRSLAMVKANEEVLQWK
jgi:hypothetical protein